MFSIVDYPKVALCKSGLANGKVVHKFFFLGIVAERTKMVFCLPFAMYLGRVLWRKLITFRMI